jgi:hypothetical protein
LPAPALGGNTETEEQGNVIGASAMFIEMDDPFADRQWNCSYDSVLPDSPVFRFSGHSMFGVSRICRS